MEIRYGLRRIILPILASAGIAFSGLEARAQNTMYDCAAAFEMKGQHQNAVGAAWLGSLVQESDNNQRMEAERKKIAEETARLVNQQRDLEEKTRRINQEKQNAREVKSIYINNPTPKPRIEEQKPMYISPDGNIKIFVCNYGKDFNGDGEMNLEEFVGISTKFKRGDFICPVVQVFENKGKNYRQVFYDSTGKEIKELTFSCILPLNGLTLHSGNEEQLKVVKKALDGARAGAFKQVVYLDDKYAGSWEFTIEGENQEDKKAEYVYDKDGLIDLTKFESIVDDYK